MKHLKISIIIANYNNGIFFKDCYNSLISQTSNDWEAIVIDDCSTDNSIDIILELTQNDPRFRFYKNELNLGYQKTILRGIELSDEHIFARLDPDDALTPNAIEIMVNAHKNHPDAGLIYSNLISCDDKLKEIQVHYTKQVSTLDHDYLNLNGEISHFATFKKNVYQLTSGIDPFIKRAEDKDIYMKMCEVAPVKHINENLYLYRIHNQGSSTAGNSEKALFWHWVALIKMAERRNVNIEDLFVELFVSRSSIEKKLNRIKKSKWARLGHKLGLFKVFKEL